ncbi:circularly permuted type 2 ATP-grasp protein [Streptomyces sp.]|uniref:circularly permuted type 2 ATP-grasp protein n=1 Tax=Streptomyces sp. TaxID=1931 RepID=UPI002F3F493C
MADIFDSYTPADAWDEMFERPGVVRPAYAAVIAALQPLDVSDLRFRTDQMARVFTDRGVTYSYGGEERPFPLDLVPRLLDAVEWDQLARGVRQRVRALEAFLADAYGRQRVLADGVVPYRLVYSSPHFHRAAHGIEPPNGVRIHVSGIDLVRDEEGRFRVLEDNVRVPSGVSYVIENRRVMTRTFPALFAEQPVRPVDEYPQRLLAALKKCAPDGVTDPVVVVLTPGVANAAYFEHALLARLMGVQLVEGRDLICTGNQVRMRTTRGETPVHVVYRRLDDDFLDPVHFRPDSLIGVPGIMTAARAGNVTLANAVGNGIADDKLLYTYVPDLIRYYLGEEPLLPNVETIRPEEPGRLAEVLDQLDKLVLKPIDGAGGKGIVIGPRAERPVLERLAKEVAADPRGWIAQRPVSLSTSPTLSRRADGSDALAPRHIDLRPFAVHDGDDVWLLPGGLTRVALGEGNLIVNSSQGGGSKDTWVLPGSRGPRAMAKTARPAPAADAGQSAPVEVSPRQFGPGAVSAPGGQAQEEAHAQ